MSKVEPIEPTIDSLNSSFGNYEWVQPPEELEYSFLETEEIIDNEDYKRYQNKQVVFDNIAQQLGFSREGLLRSIPTRSGRDLAEVNYLTEEDYQDMLTYLRDWRSDQFTAYDALVETAGYALTGIETFADIFGNDRVDTVAEAINMFGDHEQKDWLVPLTDISIPGIGDVGTIYITPSEPVSPLDCERWPNSPYCDGLGAIEGLLPDIETYVSTDGCQFSVRLTPSIFWISFPPVDITYTRPQCRIPVDPTNEDNGNYSAPIPNRANNNPYNVQWANVPVQACRFLFAAYYDNFENFPTGTLKPGIVETWRTLFCQQPPSFSPFIYTTAPTNQTVLGTLGRVMIGEAAFFLSNKQLSFWDRWQEFNPGQDPYNVTNPLDIRYQLLNGPVSYGSFTYQNLVYAYVGSDAYQLSDTQRWRVLDVYNRRPQSGFNQGWFNFVRNAFIPISEWSYEEIQYHADRGFGPFESVQGFKLLNSSCLGPPQPNIQFLGGPQDMSCNCGEIQDMLLAIYKVIDPPNYPVKMPATLFNSFADNPLDGLERYAEGLFGEIERPGEYETIESFPLWFNWFIKQFDTLLGEWPIKLKIKDTDPTKQGDQEEYIELPNIAETLAELVVMNYKGNLDGEVNQQILFRLIPELVATKNSSIVTQSLARSLVDYMGFRTKNKMQEVNYAFTPDADTNLEKFFKESKKKIQITEDADPHTLIEHIQRLLFFGGIVESVFLKKEGDAEILEDMFGSYAESADDTDFIQWLKDINDQRSTYNLVNEQGNPQVQQTVMIRSQEQSDITDNTPTPEP